MFLFDKTINADETDRGGNLFTRTMKQRSNERLIPRVWAWLSRRVTQTVTDRHKSQVARWYLFEPKIPIWVNFVGPRLENVYIFYIFYLEYLRDIWDILWQVDTFCVHLVHFFPVLVSCTEKNVATLHRSTFRDGSTKAKWNADGSNPSIQNGTKSKVQLLSPVLDQKIVFLLVSRVLASYI
jgi:hypothetical protein